MGVPGKRGVPCLCRARGPGAGGAAPAPSHSHGSARSPRWEEQHRAPCHTWGRAAAGITLKAHASVVIAAATHELKHLPMCWFSTGGKRYEALVIGPELAGAEGSAMRSHVTRLVLTRALSRRRFPSFHPADSPSLPFHTAPASSHVP